VKTLDIFRTGNSMANLPELPLKVRMAAEHKSLGLYLSNHPLDYHGAYVRAFTSHSLAQLSQLERATSVVIGGICVDLDSHITRNSSRKYIITLNDRTDIRNILFFMEQARVARFLKIGDVAFYNVTVDEVDSAKRIIAHTFTPLIMSPWKYGQILVLKIDSQNCKVLESYVPGCCSHFPGPSPVFVDSSLVPRGYQNYRVSITPDLVRFLMSILGRDKVKIAGRKGIAVDPIVMTIDDRDDNVHIGSKLPYEDALFIHGDKYCYLLDDHGKVCRASDKKHLKSPTYYTVVDLPYWIKFKPGEYSPPVTRKRRFPGKRRKTKAAPGMDSDYMYKGDDREAIDGQLRERSGEPGIL
jgi:hypothetical protein